MSDAYPDACQSCGIYKSCASWKEKPLYAINHLQENEYDRPGVLVVLSSPDAESGWGQSSPAMRFLHKTLNCLEVPWMITGAMRCHVSGKYEKDKIVLCTKQFLGPEIREVEMEIGCIVGCGEQSLRALFPESDIKLDKARQGILQYTIDGMPIPVIFTNHPTLQYKDKDSGGRDLREEYGQVFRIAERICLDKFPAFPPFQKEVVNTWRDFDELVQPWNFVEGTLTALDIEQAWNANNPERPNCLAEGAYVICVQFGWRDQNNVLRCVVVDTSQWDNMTVFRFLMVQCKGKDLIGSNVLQYDIPAICARAGYHHSHVTAFFQNCGRIYDTYVYGTCIDEESVGNGLKGQVWARFRVPRWDGALDVWKETEEAKALRKQLGRPLDYGDYPRDMLFHYAALDVYWNYVLGEDFVELFDENHFAQPYYELQVRGAHAACILSLTGIPVDPELAKQKHEEYVERRKSLQHWLNTHPFAQFSGKPGEMSASSPQQSSKLLDALKKLDPTVNSIAYKKTESGMWQLDDKAPAGKSGTLSQLAEIPNGIGQFFQVFKQVRDCTNDMAKLLMPVEWGWPSDQAHYPVPHTRIYPEWKCIKYGGDGADSGRWANKPNVHNTKSDDVIEALYTGYYGGDYETGWYCE